MAVRIRLKRYGRRHRPFFRLAAMEARNPRNGRVLEELGHYDPTLSDPLAQVQLKEDRIKHWLSVGALPTDTVRDLLKKHGITSK
ncbi:MAG: 30S ribosomal protein S16 [Planctomycetota bacterium]